MSLYTVEEKEAFRLVGYPILLNEAAVIHADHYSAPKTEFFKSVIVSGKLAALRPLAESKYGYGAVGLKEGGTFYYAGVATSQPPVDGTEEVLFPRGRYLVLSSQGGLSRLAFDKLMDQAFREILTGDFPYAYAGGPIAEILLNGNPADAEVEVWIQVIGT